MVRTLKTLTPWLLSMSIGIGIAVVAVPVGMTVSAWYSAYWAAENPPATLSWESIERIDQTSLRFRLLVTRHFDCGIGSVRGYSGEDVNRMFPVEYIGREDGYAPRNYPVGISVVSAPWIMKGVYGSKIAVSIAYDCSGDIRAAPLLIGDAPR